MDQASSTELTIRGKALTVRVPATDIDRCIRTSLWRCVLTVLSIALVVTDIPRTGLTFAPCTDGSRVAPGVVMCWGPYDYSVAHLQATQSGVIGTCEGDPLEDIELWTYKYDTLSIITRAVAQLLEVASYPACVLYRGECENRKLNVTTVFYMLDGLVTALQLGKFANPSLETQPLLLVTKSNWLDRLHHIIFKHLTKNPETRLHAIYHVSSRDKSLPPRIDLCGGHISNQRTIPTASRPILCDQPITWWCSHPTDSKNNERIPIWDHMRIRFESLQLQYPDLELDFSLFISTIVEQTHSDSHSVPSVSFFTEAVEVVTLIRGRTCNVQGRNCTTVFVDDYRYERVALESDQDRWANYVKVLRGGSQLYIWVRVVLLVWGCYRARAAEEKYRQHGFVRLIPVVVLTLLKIPCHAIVYGSWIPILGYALAHYFDSGVVHMAGEYTWSSVDGFYAFNLVKYIMWASIQMRNLWMLVLVCKIGLRAQLLLAARYQVPTEIERGGLVVVRTGWVSLLSWLTTFSMARSLAFRDTQVVSVKELPRHIPINMLRALPVTRNYTDYAFRFDLKSSLVVLVVVAAGGQLFCWSVRVVTGQSSRVFLCRSFYVPLSAKSVWSWSAKDAYWGLNLNDSRSNGRVHALPPRVGHAGIPPLAMSRPQSSVEVSCPVCSFRPSSIHWRSTLGCVVHEPIFSIHHRTRAIWSVMRLSNIANMSDPVVLFQLYVVGVPLYVYHVAPNGHPPYLLLLPSRVPACANRSTAKEDVIDSTTFTIEKVVNSRDVPWHVLINCG